MDVCGRPFCESSHKFRWILCQILVNLEEANKILSLILLILFLLDLGPYFFSAQLFIQNFKNKLRLFLSSNLCFNHKCIIDTIYARNGYYFCCMYRYISSYIVCLPAPKKKLQICKKREVSEVKQRLELGTSKQGCIH